LSILYTSGVQISATNSVVIVEQNSVGDCVCPCRIDLRCIRYGNVLVRLDLKLVLGLAMNVRIFIMMEAGIDLIIGELVLGTSVCSSVDGAKHNTLAVCVFQDHVVRDKAAIS
jgi:hypothetical protein